MGSGTLYLSSHLLELARDNHVRIQIHSNDQHPIELSSYLVTLSTFQFQIKDPTSRYLYIHVHALSAKYRLYCTMPVHKFELPPPRRYSRHNPTRLLYEVLKMHLRDSTPDLISPRTLLS